MSVKNSNKKGHFIFRTWITVKGERIYAKSYGKKAFKIWVTE